MNSLPERAKIGTADPRTNIDAVNDRVNDRKSFRDLRFHDSHFHDFNEENVFLLPS